MNGNKYKPGSRQATEAARGTEVRSIQALLRKDIIDRLVAYKNRSGRLTWAVLEQALNEFLEKEERKVG